MEETGNSKKKLAILISIVLGGTGLIAWSLISVYSSGGIQLEEEALLPEEAGTSPEEKEPAEITEPDVKEDTGSRLNEGFSLDKGKGNKR